MGTGSILGDWTSKWGSLFASEKDLFLLLAYVLLKGRLTTSSLVHMQAPTSEDEVLKYTRHYSLPAYDMRRIRESSSQQFYSHLLEWAKPFSIKMSNSQQEKMYRMC